ncbi:RNA polymerase sigma factor [Paenibacillus psychroresistens]|uniref:RNA polymerase sigma factor n=1 Tax=Paenibacillus psychroresistens TaxID=1778678 RepID=A0A6B8RJ26_9BACL|nr:RNA polymerase sigma factor [Paenibacillus psychroresistens]QGQ95553.1 RNA polymerase sigma factor [Paenibacillus psychroresistens]
MKDEDLAELYQQGDEAAMEAIIYRYHAPIQSYIYRMLNNQMTAEELAQECFIKVCISLKSGSMPTQFRPWIYRIATNLCKDLWRKSSYRSEISTEQDKLNIYPGDETVSSIMEKQWEREEVIQALDDLSEGNREIIVLRFYEDLKLEEIASIVDMPVNTVKSRLYKSLKRLAQMLQANKQSSEQSSISMKKKGGYNG